MNLPMFRLVQGTGEGVVRFRWSEGAGRRTESIYSNWRSRHFAQLTRRERGCRRIWSPGAGTRAHFLEGRVRIDSGFSVVSLLDYRRGGRKHLALVIVEENA